MIQTGKWEKNRVKKKFFFKFFAFFQNLLIDRGNLKNEYMASYEFMV